MYLKYFCRQHTILNTSFLLSWFSFLFHNICPQSSILTYILTNIKQCTHIHRHFHVYFFCWWTPGLVPCSIFEQEWTGIPVVWYTDMRWYDYGLFLLSLIYFFKMFPSDKSDPHKRNPHGIKLISRYRNIWSLMLLLTRSTTNFRINYGITKYLLKIGGRMISMQLYIILAWYRSQTSSNKEKWQKALFCSWNSISYL